MLVVGLTGGIGSGKSTVANLFASHGVPIIDADIIAREITEPGTPALAKISEHFGKAIIQSDGSLDRSRLRTIIFDNADERIWLEELLHPLIRKAIQHQLQALKHAPYCLIVVPLLLESEPYPFIDRILVVDVPEEIQIERVSRRDKTTATQVQAIIQTQMDRTLRLSEADDVIINNGSLAALEDQVTRFHKIYTKL